MRRKRVLVAAASCLLIIAGVLLHGFERANAFAYVQNGSFEDGTAGWLAVGDGIFEAVDAGVVPMIDGSYSAAITLQGPAVTLRQPAFANVPPGTYRVSAEVRATKASTRMFARASSISPSTSFREEFAPSAPNIWEAIAFDFVVPEISDVKVEVGAQGSAGDIVYVDEVRFDGAAPVERAPTAVDTVVAAATQTGLPDTRTPVATKTRAATRTPAPTRTPSTLAAANVTGPDLLNGGFEDVDGSGAVVGWSRYGGSLSDAASPVRSGSRAARFESDSASTKWIYQTVSVDPGSVHTFGAWIYDGDANVASAFLRVSWYASGDASGTSIGSLDSTQRLETPEAAYRFLTTGGVVAPAEAGSARLRVMLAPTTAGTAVIYIDDASFEPASLDDAAPAPSAGATSEVAAASSGGAATGRTTSRRQTGSGGDPRFAAGPSSLAKIVINEVMYDPDIPGSDAEGEWIELFNSSATSIDLKGWTLADNGGSDALGPYRLEPLQYVVVAASTSLKTGTDPYTGPMIVAGGRIGNSLGNAGDRLRLKDAGGAVADAISWGSDATILDPAIPDVPAGHSVERRVPGSDTDSAEDFVDNVRPSPGGPYDEAAGTPKGEAAGRAGTLAASGGGASTWLSWGAVGLAGATLAAVGAWQALPLLRRRMHRPG